MRLLISLLAVTASSIWAYTAHADTDPLGFWEEVPVETTEEEPGFFGRLFGFGSDDSKVGTTKQGVHRQFTLDVLRLRSALDILGEAAPHVNAASKIDDSISLFSAIDSEAPTAIITIPEPDGTFTEYTVARTYALSSDLAAEFPEIATYRGVPVDDERKGEELRFEISPIGFQASAIKNGQQSVIIPVAIPCGQIPATTNHLVYLKAKSPTVNNQSTCRLDEGGTIDNTAGTLLLPEIQWGDDIRVFRLAIAATAEYTKELGGTKVCAMSGIAKAVNRINRIFERDLAVTFELVANGSKLIFEDPSTDPFSNDDIESLIEESQQVIDSIIGDEHYDVGHTFSTYDGGLASAGAGQAGYKASGVSGSDDPSNDDFYVSFFAHELAHQFGGNHTYNSLLGNCSRRNWNRHTAYEPGSGSTILSYAGGCSDGTADDDVTVGSDPYFHNVSLLEMTNYISTQLGAITSYQSNNSVPTVDAGYDYVVPIDTPFYLDAEANDADGDPFTFVWEQLDRGSQLNLGDGDNGASPLFRSYPPDDSAYREFGLDSTQRGETRPALMRYSNFRITVRDNHGAGRTNLGAVASDTVSVTFDDSAGPFRLVRPSVRDTTIRSGKYLVKWAVAGTDSDLIDAKTVDITASSDGGTNYDLELAMDTPNDGSEEVIIPSSIRSLIIDISPKTNVFFDRSFELTVKP